MCTIETEVESIVDVGVYEDEVIERGHKRGNVLMDIILAYTQYLQIRSHHIISVYAGLSCL
jgi:hypothetical protein